MTPCNLNDFKNNPHLSNLSNESTLIQAMINCIIFCTKILIVKSYHQAISEYFHRISEKINRVIWISILLVYSKDKNYEAFILIQHIMCYVCNDEYINYDHISNFLKSSIAKNNYSRQIQFFLKKFISLKITHVASHFPACRETNL